MSQWGRKGDHNFCFMATLRKLRNRSLHLHSFVRCLYLKYIIFTSKVTYSASKVCSLGIKPMTVVCIYTLSTQIRQRLILFGPDAEVEVKTQSDNVTEGDWILFICGSCIPSMTVPTYIWRKDGHLHSQRHGDNILDLESVEPEDRGQYFCTISGHEGLNSTSVNITVRPGCK